MYNNILSLPGGSTKAIQIAVAALEVYATGFKPDAILCTSAGTFVAIALELGLRQELLDEALSLTPATFFKINPFNKKGGISFKAWCRVIKGLLSKKNSSYSLGIQNTLPLFEKYLTLEKFEEYKRDPKSADIIVYTVNPSTRLPEYKNIKQLSLEQALLYMEASAHIPITTQAIHVLGRDLIDGGNWAHNPEWLFLQKGNRPKEIISIYPREKVFKQPISKKWKENLFTNIENTVSTFNVALSTCGQSMAYWYCKANNIKHLQLFCPQVLDELYDFDKDQLEEAARLTRQFIREQLEKYNK